MGMRLEQFHAVWLNVLSVHLTDCCHAHEIYDWYVFTKTLVDVQNNELESECMNIKMTDKQMMLRVTVNY